jgi:hypothetical protein
MAGEALDLIQAVMQTGKDRKGHDVTPARMRAAELTLQRTVPSLQSQEVIQETKVQYLVQTPLEETSPEAWEQAAARITDNKKAH